MASNIYFLFVSVYVFVDVWEKIIYASKKSIMEQIFQVQATSLTRIIVLETLRSDQIGWVVGKVPELTI